MTLVLTSKRRNLEQAGRTKCGCVINPRIAAAKRTGGYVTPYGASLAGAAEGGSSGQPRGLNPFCDIPAPSSPAP